MVGVDAGLVDAPQIGQDSIGEWQQRPQHRNGIIRHRIVRGDGELVVCHAQPVSEDHGMRPAAPFSIVRQLDVPCQPGQANNGDNIEQEFFEIS